MAVRRLNTQFVVILLAVIVVVGSIAFGAYKYNGARANKQYYEQGNAAYEQGDWDTAITNFQKFLSSSKDTEKREEVLHKMAIRFAEKLGESAAGTPAQLQYELGIIETAFQNNNRDPVLKEALARCYANTGKSPRAAELYGQLANEFPDKPEYSLQEAKCYQTAGNSKAETVLIRLMSNHPQYIDGYLAHANYCEIVLNQLDSAISTLNAMVTSNPQNASAYANSAIFYLDHPELQNNIENAVENVTMALKLDKHSPDALIAATKLAIFQKNYTRARESLDGLASSNDPRVLTLQIQLADAEGKPEDAVDILRAHIQTDPNNIAQRLQLFQRLIALKRIDEAKEEVAQLRTVHKMPNELVGFFEATIEVLEGKWQNAVRKLEIAKKFLTTSELRAFIDRQRAECYGKLGQTDKQLEAFKEAIDNASGNEIVPFYIAYIRTLNSTGKTAALDKAIQDLRDKIGTEAFMKISELRSIYIALRTQEQASLPKEKQDWTEINRLLEEFGEAGNPDNVLLQVRLLIRQGHVGDARDLLKKSIAEQPEVLVFTSYLALLEAQEKNFSEALRIVDAELEKNPGATGMILTKIRIAIQLESMKASEVLKKVEADLAEFPDMQKLVVLKQLAVAWLQFDNLGEAKRLFEIIAKVEPQNIGVKVQMFDLAKKAEDEAEMKAMMAVIRTVAGAGSPEYRYCQAAETIWQYNHKKINLLQLGKAKDYLNYAQSVRPNWVNVPRAQAEIALIEKDYDAAIGYLYRIQDLGTLSPQQFNLLINLLYRQKRDAEVKTLCERFRDIPLAADAAMMGVEAMVNTESGDEAVRRAADIADPNNPKDFLWKGHIALRAKDYREAEKAFRHVTEIAPSNPNGWLSLLQVLKIQDVAVPQEEFIENVKKSVSADKLPLCLAKCYQLFGDAKLAETTYQEALNQMPEDIEVLFSVSQFYMCTTRPDMAVPHLQKMMELIALDKKLGADIKTQHLAWTRRSLAQVYGGLNNYDAREQALVMIDENLRQQPDSVDDLKVKALLLSERRNPADNQRAIEMLESIPNLLTKERFVLAKLYYIQSSSSDAPQLWEKCQTLMGDLIDKNASNAEFVRAFIRMMLHQNEPVSEILPFVNLLEGLAPGLPDTILFRAQIIALSGDAANAEKLLLTEIPKPLSEENLSVYLSYAQELELMGRFEGAEKIWDMIFEFSPEAGLPKYEFLARQNRIPDALAWLEKAAPSVPSTLILNAIPKVFQYAPKPPKDEDFTRAAALGKNVAKDTANSLEYKLFAAQFYEAEGMFDHALESYDAMLKTDLEPFQKACVQNSYAYLLAMTDKEMPKAIQMIEEVIRAFPNEPNFLDTRAVIFSKTDDRNKIDQAIQDLTRAIITREDPLLYFHLANAYFRKGNLNSARISFAVAKRDAPFLYQSLPKVEVKDYNALTAGLK